jgi:hypothetical protein
MTTNAIEHGGLNGCWIIEHGGINGHQCNIEHGGLNGCWIIEHGGINGHQCNIEYGGLKMAAGSLNMAVQMATNVILNMVAYKWLLDN